MYRDERYTLESFSFRAVLYTTTIELFDVVLSPPLISKKRTSARPSTRTNFESTCCQGVVLSDGTPEGGSTLEPDLPNFRKVYLPWNFLDESPISTLEERNSLECFAVSFAGDTFSKL